MTITISADAARDIGVVRWGNYRLRLQRNGTAVWVTVLSYRNATDRSIASIMSMDTLHPQVRILEPFVSEGWDQPKLVAELLRKVAELYDADDAAIRRRAR